MTDTPNPHGNTKANHPNRNWRARWTTERGSATHVSGLRVVVSPSPTDPTKDRLTFEGVADIDQTTWNIGRLREEGTRLYLVDRSI